MVLDTTRENISLSKIVGQKKENFIVEGDVIVPDIKPDVLNVINTSGNICIYKKIVADGKVRFDGCIQVYLIYLADTEEATTRGMYTVLDFSKTLDFEGCNESMSLNNIFKIKNITSNVINGRKISIKAEVEVKAKIYTNEIVNLITTIDEEKNVQKLDSSVDVNIEVGTGSTKVYAKDKINLEASDNLAEILKIDFKICNKEKKISYNKILAKAETQVCILYLTEDNRINKIEAGIPIMGFIDIPGVEENNFCEINYELKNLIIKPNSDEQNEIYFEAEIEIFCSVFQRKQIDIMEDLYSPTVNLSFQSRKVNIMTDMECIDDTYMVREKIPMPELINAKIYDITVEPQIRDTKILNGRILYDGDVILNVIYANEMGTLNLRQITLPFNFNTDIEKINENSNIETETNIISKDCLLLPDGNLDAKIDIGFKIYTNTMQNINIIEEITEEEKKMQNNYSMIIYFVKQGDTLWNIAKKFSTTVEKIANLNSIDNANNLQIGTQLYIPKFVST